MEAPPQFPGAPKKSKTGLVLGLIALAIVLCCCGCGSFAYFYGRKAFGKALGLVECGVAMGQQRDALLAYAKAHGGKLPGSGNWQDDIRPYVRRMPNQDRSNGLFVIPDAAANYCDKGASTAITFNSGLAGKKVDDVKEPYEAIVLFETPGLGHNRAAAYQEQPFETSPILMQTERRGWIRQPLKGQAAYKDKFGQLRPAPSAGASASASFGSTNGDSKTGSDD